MPALLLLKLFLVPALIAGITLAGRRWGATVAGSLAGFPVVTGPILYFVAIEQGPQFASHVAVAATVAVLSNIAFGIAYSWACRRNPWYVSLLLGWMAYFGLVALLNTLTVSALWAGGLTSAGLFIASKCYPQQSADVHQVAEPKSDLIYRMLAAASLVLAITLFSAQLGSNLTGLLSVFPVMGSVLAVFSQRHYGAGYAVKILQGMVRGFYAFTVFCVILALTLGTQPLLVCFSIALFSAVILQTFLMQRTDQKMKPS